MMSAVLDSSVLDEHEPETEAEPPGRSLRGWYATMLAGGALGIITASWQTVARIDWAAGKSASGVCEISDKLSCGTVFDHWQSSALGIPNGLIAVPVFAALAATGLAGLMGSQLSRRYLGVILGVTLFMTAFVTWYMEQTAFDIGVLCLYCLGCMLNIVIAGVGVTRVAAAERALGDGRAGNALGRLVDANLDLVAWAFLVGVVGVMLFAGLYG